jgi:hypothetical protein
MFGKFLGEVKGYFGKGFVLAVWVPVLIASVAILITFAGIQGKIEAYWQGWLGLGSQLQTIVGILVFFAITLVAFLLHNLQLQITQFFEGYWPDIGPMGKVKQWKIRRYIRQFKNRCISLKDLEEKIPQLEEEIRQLEETNSQSSQLQQLETERQRMLGRLMQQKVILSKEFPVSENEILATSFGNRYRSAEEYPMDRYGIDSVVFWPRLLEVVPKGLQARLQDAKIAVDFWLLCSLLCGLYTGVVLICTIFIKLGGWTIGLVLLGAVLTVFNYRAALPPVMAYGELIRVAFDLYRRPLLVALDLEPPETLKEEKILWKKLALFMNHRFDLPEDVPFKKSGAKLTESQGE